MGEYLDIKKVLSRCFGTRKYQYQPSKKVLTLDFNSCPVSEKVSNLGDDTGGGEAPHARVKIEQGGLRRPGGNPG